MILEKRNSAPINHISFFLFTEIIFILFAGEILYITENIQNFLIIFSLFLLKVALTLILTLKVLFSIGILGENRKISYFTIGIFSLVVTMIIELDLLLNVSINSLLPSIPSNMLLILNWILNMVLLIFELIINYIISLRIIIILIILGLIILNVLILKILQKKVKNYNLLERYPNRSIVFLVLILELILYFFVQSSNIFISSTILWTFFTAVTILMPKSEKQKGKNDYLDDFLIFWGLILFLIYKPISAIFISPFLTAFNIDFPFLMNILPIVIVIGFYTIYFYHITKIPINLVSSLNRKILLFIIFSIYFNIFFVNIVLSSWMLFWLLGILLIFIVILKIPVENKKIEQNSIFTSSMLISTLFIFYLIGL